MKTFKLSTLALSLSAALLAPSAQAVLERVGPTVQANGYPAWFQDKSGLTLDFGTPSNQSELDGGWLLILPPNVPSGTAPETFPTNFSDEHFYWNATSGNKIQGGMVLVLAVEGAFSTGAVSPGAQIAFSRLRIKIASIPVAGNYKVYTPYGVYDFPNQAVGDKLFSTLDAGITCGGNFECALDTPIGPFLTPAAAPGAAEVPPIPDLTAGLDPYYDGLVNIGANTPYPNNGRKYLADPARLGPLTGGTCALTTPVPAFPQPGDCIMGNAATDLPGQPTRPVYVVSGPAGTELRDPNIFRVEVNGVEVKGDPRAGGEHAFTVMGRVLTTPIPGKITLERASYTDNATIGKKLDVFATAFPSLNPRIPSGQAATTSNPDLMFWNTSCGGTAASPTAPTTTGIAGVPLTQTQMFRDTPTGNLWWAQQIPTAIPAQVCVVDNGRITPLYFNVDVSDEVDVLSAYYDPATATLKVNAMSSDCTTNPALLSGSVGALAIDPTAPADSCIKTASLVNVMAPPHKVTVTSLRGGVASLDVRTSVGSPSLTGVVDPNTDFITMDEDCSASPALTCAAPQSIDVLANDIFNGGPVPAGATVTLVTPPVNGVATVVGTNINYTPKANFNGLDLIGYKVTNAGVTSTEGFVHVTVAPVNDLPVAVNDTSSAVRNVAQTLNLLTNDTDPDGVADLSAVEIQSLPAGGATLLCNGNNPVVVGTVCNGGTVTFTGPTAGTVYTFSYKALDAAGALSANTATVRVTTGQAEALQITRSLFTGKTWRWQLDGTTSVPAGQNIAVKYQLPAGTKPLGYRTVANGACTPLTAANNPVIYTLASSVTTGAFTLDLTNQKAGFVNPTNTGQTVTGFWCSGTVGATTYFGTPNTLQFTSPFGGSTTSAIGFR